ncbi:hypothetical protein HY490_00865 [Candidatus Woesearchaeota archaeon]|nr:hypothetical protein [Candidatus Woesearchaeota archaeon]
MAQTVLGNVIVFFQQIGIYDVVLPFLLTFAIVFAILDKTRIFGDEPGQQGQPRKNINAIIAFATGFLVLASAELVEAITTISARMVVVFLLLVAFLMLAGMFFKGETELKKYFLDEKWNALFVGASGVGVLFVFLASIKTRQGTTFLDELINYVSQFWTSTAVASIIMMIFIIGVVYFIQKSPEKPAQTQQSGGSGP